MTSIKDCKICISLVKIIKRVMKRRIPRKRCKPLKKYRSLNQCSAVKYVCISMIEIRECHYVSNVGILFATFASKQ